MSGHRKRNSESSTVESHQETADQSSQDAMETEMMITARKLFISNKRRKDLKRKMVENEYEERIEKAKTGVSEDFKKRQVKAKEIRNSQWQKIIGLNTEKENLESLIIKSITRIEQATLNLSIGMTAIFSGRIQELEDTTPDLRA
ncbi:hypothetical protein F5884DRAFT_177190 [Xylogone sp. PMI_703]|nr:hypothetical protein F5884DRAFT_177190 [Xylogone sp. PMI_703]